MYQTYAVVAQKVSTVLILDVSQEFSHGPTTLPSLFWNMAVIVLPLTAAVTMTKYSQLYVSWPE